MATCAGEGPSCGKNNGIRGPPASAARGQSPFLGRAATLSPLPPLPPPIAGGPPPGEPNSFPLGGGVWLLLEVDAKVPLQNISPGSAVPSVVLGFILRQIQRFLEEDQSSFSELWAAVGWLLGGRVGERSQKPARQRAAVLWPRAMDFISCLLH